MIVRHFDLSLGSWRAVFAVYFKHPKYYVEIISKMIAMPTDDGGDRKVPECTSRGHERREEGVVVEVFELEHGATMRHAVGLPHRGAVCLGIVQLSADKILLAGGHNAGLAKKSRQLFSAR